MVRIKPRSILIVTFSSVLISLVLFLTVLGFFVYLEWRTRNIDRDYFTHLCELNVRLFERFIDIELSPVIEDRKVYIVGSIKNNSNKKIYSLRLKIGFYDLQNRAVYVKRFYPIGVGARAYFLAPGDSISFKKILTNTPDKVTRYVTSKYEFAKREETVSLKLMYKIELLDIR